MSNILFNYTLESPIIINVSDINNYYSEIKVISLDILEPKIGHIKNTMYSLDGLKNDLDNCGFLKHIKQEIFENPDYAQSDSYKTMIGVITHTQNGSIGEIQKKIDNTILNILTTTLSPSDKETLVQVAEREGKLPGETFLQARDIDLISARDFRNIVSFFLQKYYQEDTLIS